MVSYGLDRAIQSCQDSTVVLGRFCEGGFKSKNALLAGAVQAPHTLLRMYGFRHVNTAAFS